MDFQNSSISEPLLSSGQGGNIDLAIFPNDCDPLPDLESLENEDCEFTPNKRQRTD